MRERPRPKGGRTVLSLGSVINPGHEFVLATQLITLAKVPITQRRLLGHRVLRNHDKGLAFEVRQKWM